MRDRPQLLVVDDDIAIRDVVSIALEGEGFRVVTADDGRSGLRLLARGLRPDCILLDLRMPEVDGFEFRRSQLAHAEIAGIPVVAFPGAADPDAAAQARRLGIRGLLQKPVDLGALLYALVDAIGLKA